MTDVSKTVSELDELMAAIRGFDDPRRASDQWKQAYRLLQKTELPSANVTHVVGMRDVDGLAALIGQLSAPPEANAAGDDEAPDPEICKRAMRAFRKRLSVTILDEESSLGRGPLSKGSKNSVALIVPPADWPESVWQELVRQRKLRYTGHGMYGLAKQ